MKRPKEEDFIEQDEKPDGTIIGYLNEGAYIEALNEYINLLESHIK